MTWPARSHLSGFPHARRQAASSMLTVRQQLTSKRSHHDRSRRISIGDLDTRTTALRVLLFINNSRWQNTVVFVCPESSVVWCIVWFLNGVILQCWRVKTCFFRNDRRQFGMVFGSKSILKVTSSKFLREVFKQSMVKVESTLAFGFLLNFSKVFW